jgi:hypothetical protein
MIFLDIITQAYRLAGVLKGPGRGLSGSEQEEGRHVLNGMLNRLKTERCFAYYIERTYQPITNGKQSYTVGAEADGADWILADRPQKIQAAGFLVPSVTESEIPMDVLLDYKQWRDIINKLVPASQPRVLYYQAQLPVGVAQVWPVPTVDSQIVIYTIAALQSVSDVNDPALLPDGYPEFLEYQLACQVHDRYPLVQMGPGVERRAMDAKSRVMANQLTPLFIGSDEGALSRPPRQRWYDARTWTP